MLLENKTAVIYGAGGAVGGAVARAFAREGATVFMTGRTLAKVEAVAREISAAGGEVEAAQVDALDERAVEQHLDAVVEKAGGIDISFNAIGIPATVVAEQGMQGTPLVDLPIESFALPITTYTRAHFVTGRGAARRLIQQRRPGVILMHTPEPARAGAPLLGGMGPAWAALEAMCRGFSAEFASYGIRHLPPRQRAVLLLRDVLGWSAGETAGLLDASVASVNSALQRARATLEQRAPSDRPSAQPAPDEGQRAILERYLHAWEDADLDTFVSLLREDAVLNMPPWPQWYRGRESIRAMFAWAWQTVGWPIRLVPIAANRQPAFALYRGGTDGPELRAHGIWVLTLQGEEIAALTGFLDPTLFPAFGLPDVLPAQGAAPSVPGHAQGDR